MNQFYDNYNLYKENLQNRLDSIIVGWVHHKLIIFKQDCPNLYAALKSSILNEDDIAEACLRWSGNDFAIECLRFNNRQNIAELLSIIDDGDKDDYLNNQLTSFKKQIITECLDTFKTLSPYFNCLNDITEYPTVDQKELVELFAFTFNASFIR